MHDALFSLQRAVVLSEEVGAIMKLPLWKPGNGSPAVTGSASGAALQEQQPPERPPPVITAAGQSAQLDLQPATTPPAYSPVFDHRYKTVCILGVRLP